MDNKETNFVEDTQNLSIEKILYLEELSKYELSEKDFYPPEDTRVLMSGIDDVDDGDNFSEFTEHFFDMCYEEEYFDE